jgi:CelD/BcsL family acetyltransferase involved in cellulose biosynthesis
MSVTCEIVMGPAAVDGLCDEWRSLAAAADCAPFLTWEWMSAWQARFGGDPFIIKIHRGKDLIGILPLRQARIRIIGLGYTQLGFLGDGPGGADRLDLIARREDQYDAAAASLHFLAKEGFDLVRLENLRPGSPTVQSLKNTVLEGVTHCERDGYTCPQIDLTPGWDEVLARSRRRSNFGRRLRRLKALDGFEFRSVTSPAELSAAFDRFLDLHRKRRPGRASALSGSSQLVRFHRDVVARMSATGWLRFDELWCEGALRASIYAFDDGSTFYYYNTGFDTDWADRSVGLVLIGLSIRAAADRGVQTYDFLRGDEAYKFDWANRTERLVNVTIAGNRTAARIAHTVGDLGCRVRAMARNKLPERLTSFGRRARALVRV